MKLYISQIPGPGVRGQSFAIYNEAGEKLVGVTSASIHHNMDDAARLDLSLVVDGTNIVFGDPPDKTKREIVSDMCDRIKEATK